MRAIDVRRRWPHLRMMSTQRYVLQIATTICSCSRPANLVANIKIANISHTQSAVQDEDTHSLRSRTNSTQFANGSALASTKSTVADWGTSFEKLLEDAAGLHTFAIFLQKEFSAENIYFWTACERYRFIDDHVERSKVADVIFSRHLGVGASEPVNVDSKARNIAQDNLNYADRDLFVPVSVPFNYPPNRNCQKND